MQSVFGRWRRAVLALPILLTFAPHHPLSTLSTPSMLPTAKFPRLSGSYKTIGVSTFYIREDADRELLQVVVKVLYPSAVNEPAPSSSYPYMTREQAVALAAFAKVPSMLFTHVTKIKVPAVQDAPLAASNGAKWPAVIFSHGLGGLPETYLVQATSLASHGFIVFLPTHNDRSASVSVLPDGTRVTYESPADKDESAFRSAQLVKRVDEILFVLDAVTSGSALPLEHETLRQLHESIDSEKVALIGHSFGAATVMATAAVEQKRRASLGKQSRVRAVVSLDQWMLPVHNEIANLSLKTPTLIMVGEGFRNWSQNYVVLERLYRTIDQQTRSQMCYLKGTQHSNFSDVGLYAPAFLTRMTKQIGSIDHLYCWDLINRLTLLWICKHADIQPDVPLSEDLLDHRNKPEEIVWLE